MEIIDQGWGLKKFILVGAQKGYGSMQLRLKRQRKCTSVES